MKLPFSIEQFLRLFEQYNVSVWPVQVVFNLMALALIIGSIHNARFPGFLIFLVLSFYWIWMGVVYHLMFFTGINPAAYIFGIAFILQGILFLYFALFKKQLSFGLGKNIYGITGGLLMIFALVLYPLIGYFNGHIYPASPSFGVPCPTSIFTMGILLCCNNKLSTIILIIPLVWSVIGFSAAFFLGMTEDTGLLLSGLVTGILFGIKNHTLASNQDSNGNKKQPLPG